MSLGPSGGEDLPVTGLDPVDAPAAPDVGHGETSAEKPRVENMLPRRGRRRLGLERIMVRLIATCGIVGIGVALGAILTSSKVQGWITGLVVALVSVILSAILWSSREL
jgi:protein-S-isoprenylcysteine O-methyltransferase Ste14